MAGEAGIDRPGSARTGPPGAPGPGGERRNDARHRRAGSGEPATSRRRPSRYSRAAPVGPGRAGSDRRWPRAGRRRLPGETILRRRAAGTRPGAARRPPAGIPAESGGPGGATASRAARSALGRAPIGQDPPGDRGRNVGVASARPGGPCRHPERRRGRTADAAHVLLGERDFAARGGPVPADTAGRTHPLGAGRAGRVAPVVRGLRQPRPRVPGPGWRPEGQRCGGARGPAPRQGRVGHPSRPWRSAGTGPCSSTPSSPPR